MANDKKWLTPELKKQMDEKLREKMDDEHWVDIGKVEWKAYTELSEDEQQEIATEVLRELHESENALSEIITQYPDIKKAYLDNEKRDDPFYIDYNLFFNNVDMSMALSYSNEPKCQFIPTNSADASNTDIITKTFEYEYREEMDMDLSAYELAMDKHIWWVWVVFREYNDKTNTPIPKVCPVQYFRPDPKWRWHTKRYRYMGWHGYMTKQQMRDNWDFMNIEDVIDTDRAEKEWSDKTGNGSLVSITPNWSNDEAAYFWVYTHLRTRDDGRKCLVTLANWWKLVVRYVELDYKIGWERVFPVSLDFWKPKPWYPLWILMRFLTWRKQKVLSLLLNLAVKKAVRSSLWNHIIADEAAIKNKNQLRQLTEFPEIILVDTKWWEKNVNNIVAELQHSQVPQDNYNTEERIKQLNYEETSIWPNQLWISPTWNQTATEIKDNAANSSVRLSLPNRVSMIFWKDFCAKRLMMHQAHYPDAAKKQVTVSREFWDRYMTFERKYLNMSWDPHIKVESKFDLMQKNKQLFANHVVLYSYIQQLAAAVYTPLSVRLAMRKALRLLWYDEDEILDYIEESAEETEAKEQLRMLNRNEKLEPLQPEQIDEHHKDYLHVYKQAKPNEATKAAVMDRLRMQKAQDQKNLKIQQQQQLQWTWWNTGWMQNQMTNNMINQQNQQQNWLQEVQA